MRKERKLSFCQTENVSVDSFRSRNKFGMTFEAVLVLLAAPFVMSGTVWAQCTTAPNCTTLGYTKTSNTGNCLKCPTGNYYFCPEKACVSSCSGYTLTEEQAEKQCGGNYQACRDNCSGDIVWKCAGSNTCNSSFCSGYTLTYSQAQNQCGYANYEGCNDPCTGEVLYKCDDGSGGSSGGNICQNKEEIKANYTIDCSCNDVGGQYSLIQRKSYRCKDSSAYTWETSTSLDRFARMEQCESALSQNTKNCSGTFEITPSTVGQAKCGYSCLD